MSDNNININTPDIGPYTQLRPFRFWCQKVLPLVYDESLSYYEVLCKVVDYLNKTMEDVDQIVIDMPKFKAAYDQFTGEITTNFIALGRKFDQLEFFVNNYFENLNVQTEINNKLDEMASDGTLTSIIAPYLPFITPEIYGAVGDGVTDDSAAIQAAINDLTAGKTLCFTSSSGYKVNNNITVPTSYIKLYGLGTDKPRLILGENVTISVTANYVTLENLHFYQGSGVVSTAHNLRCKDCRFSYADTGISLTNGYICLFDDCYFVFNKIGVLLNNQSYETIFNNCVIDNNQIGVIITGASSGAIFDNCTIEGNYNRDTGNGCGLIIGNTNILLNINKCWFETNGTSDASGDLIMYHGSYIPASMSDLITEINELYNISSYPAGLGLINIINSCFIRTKNNICLFNNDNIKVNIERNKFSGVLDKYNRGVYVNSTNTLPIKLTLKGNEVINTDNSAINAQMLSGVKASIVHFETKPANTLAMYKRLCSDHITLNDKPLFVYEGPLADLTGEKTPLYEYQPSGNAVDAGFLYGSHKTNSYDTSGTTYLSTTRNSSGGINLHNSVGNPIEIIIIRPVGNTVQIQDQTSGWTAVAEPLAKLNRIWRYTPATRNIIATLPCVAFELIILSTEDKNKMKECVAAKFTDIDYCLFNY